MSVEIWKIEKNLCRCCHAEGDFDNLAEPRVYLEQEEIYYNMLRECFNTEITPVPGELCAITYTICKACILRLRDASSFKKQVQHCEERFMALYCNNSVKVLNSEKVFIKLENSESDTDYNEDFMGLNDENDEEYDIKQDEDNPDSDEDRNLTLKKKTKIKSKSKTKHTPKIREDKKTKSPVKEKKGETTTFRLQAKDYKWDGKTMACSHCDKKYGKISSLRFHIKSKHYRIPKYKCPECGEEFMTIAPFTVHKLEEHSIDDRIHCNACKAMFNSKVQLRKHINIFHMMGEKFKCEVCDYESFSFEGLYKHKFKHKTSKDHHCKFCKKSFLRKTTKDLHERIHTGVKNERLFTVSTASDGTKDFSCNICQHVFKKRQNFQQHYKHVHLKQRPKLRSCHLCDVKVPGHMRAFHMEEHGLPAPSCGACGKKFSYPFQVLQHQKYYHMGERKFACEYCDLKFRSRYGLTKHTIKHTGVRSFKCEFCDKSFKWKNNLRIHLMMHLNDKRHVCPVCDEAFVQTSSLKYHIMKRHPDLV